ncbi:hypothetical protein FACS1894172_14830 [Spirochaetia bacterium]|nr:hypothetical protein FACS1894172_14830 [Spirochaetia bacterium]
MDDHTREINGISFSVTPFRAMEAFRLQSYLLRTLGPGLAEILGGLNIGSAQGINAEINGIGLARGIESLFQKLDDSALETLLKRLLYGTRAAWKGAGGKLLKMPFGEEFDNAFDVVFAGKIFTVYQLVAFILEVNFPDFFVQVGKVFGKRTRKTFSFEPAEKPLTLEPDVLATSEN